MTIRALPRTPLGWWGGGLVVAFVALFLLKVSFPLPLPTPAIFVIGGVGVILAVIAIARGERSVVLMVLGGLVGAFILFWVGGELIFPH